MTGILKEFKNQEELIMEIARLREAIHTIERSRHGYIRRNNELVKKIARLENDMV